MITSKRAERVGLLFLFAHEMYKGGIVDMYETAVNDHHSCGTTHCHAGWYAVMRDNLREKVGYAAGREHLVKDLGFANTDSLLNWARNNPKIWGNQGGTFMFCEPRAFGYSKSKLNLKVIGKHWLAVSERLK